MDRIHKKNDLAIASNCRPFRLNVKPADKYTFRPIAKIGLTPGEKPGGRGCANRGEGGKDRGVRTIYPRTRHRTWRRCTIKDLDRIERFARLDRLNGIGPEEFLGRLDAGEACIEKLRTRHQLGRQSPVENQLCVTNANGAIESFRQLIKGVVDDAAIDMHAAVIPAEPLTEVGVVKGDKFAHFGRVMTAAANFDG
jgi:hypothetical protein